ncbi:hypothetical protein FPV67DRAFT_170151 [Lyophyllum atratum]|nr:hypothetical protein FPV67DRAFT_170151 [Lyophyllum atratum]
MGELAVDVDLLSTLRLGASLSPSPALQAAARRALGITNIIQALEDKTENRALSRLAKDSCELVYAILRTGVIAEGPVPMPAELLFRDLFSILSCIERFTRKTTSRTMFYRIIKHRSDMNTIKEYRKQLTRFLGMLSLESNFSIKQNLMLIHQTLETHESRRMEEERLQRSEYMRLRTPSVSSNPFRQLQGLFSNPATTINFTGNYTSIGGDQNTHTSETATSNVSDLNGGSAVAMAGGISQSTRSTAL